MDNLSCSIGQYLNNNNLLITTAESCTAGLISATLAETPGSSQWLESGFVVYSAHAKNTMLGVSMATITKYDITSCEVAKEMSHGALINSRANVAVSVTGLAGSSGGTHEIPAGTICMSWAFLLDNKIKSFEEKKLFNGERNTMRQAVVEHMLGNIPYYHSKIIMPKIFKKIKQ